MRVTSLLGAVGLVAAGLVVASPTATAADSCSMYVPSRIAISQPFRTYLVRLGPNCAKTPRVVYASWNAYHPTQGWQDILIYDNTTIAYWDVYSFTAPAGRWTWRPSLAHDVGYNEVYQYTTYTDVRMASYGRVIATRSGSKVNVRTTAMRYWGAGEKFIGWAGARGQIQYRTPGTSTWKGLKEVYSYSNGSYSYTYSTTASREYRVVLRDVPTIWGSTSPAVRR